MSDIIKINKDKNLTLTKQQSEKLIEYTMFSSMVDEMKIERQIQAIDYQTERTAFFKQCSRNDSKHTVKQYKNGLIKLENYIKTNNINILKLSP